MKHLSVTVASLKAKVISSLVSTLENMCCLSCQEEQLKSQETRFRSVSAELQELRSSPQERKIKSKDQEEHKQREEYLDFEVKHHILLFHSDFISESILKMRTA